MNVVVPLESKSDLSIDIEFRTSYPPLLLGVELKNSDFSSEKLKTESFVALSCCL